MVTLSEVQSSNARISTALPPGLVAVFVGATSGIGEATLKQFAKHARRPRAYLVGRSQDAGDRIVAECRALNGEGTYTFIRADVSLLRVVDEVCEGIKAKEKALNILFLSAGQASLHRRETSEHLHLLVALTFYSRLRFMTNLLPLLQHPSVSALRRVVTVGGGGLEGPLDATDFQARRVPLTAIRPHICTLVSLGLEAVARSAPAISFIHDYPGTVNTPLLARGDLGVLGAMVRTCLYLFGRWICVPIEESGERHLYLASSARYPPASATSAGVPQGGAADAARGMTGAVGSGIYSVGWDGESASPAVQKRLAAYRDDGMVDEIWRDTESEFRRIMDEQGHDPS